MASDPVIDEGMVLYAELSRIEKILLLRLYCRIPAGEENDWNSLFVERENQTPAYYYFKKRIMDNTDWSVPGKMIVTYRSMPLILKQCDARLVYEKRPDGKLAQGISRSPFSQEFLKKHEESILKKAMTYDIDDMMSLAAVLSCCLHCHAANWPTAVDDFVRTLLLLPGMHSTVQSESDDVNNNTSLCDSPHKSQHAAPQPVNELSSEENLNSTVAAPFHIADQDTSTVAAPVQTDVADQDTSTASVSTEPCEPSAVNSEDNTTSSNEPPPATDYSKMPFSVDNILQAATNPWLGFPNAFNPQFAALLPNFQALAYQNYLNSVYAYNAALLFGNSFMFPFPNGGYGNLPNYAALMASFGLNGLGAGVNPPPPPGNPNDAADTGNSSNEQPAEEVPSAPTPQEMPPCQAENAGPCSPNSQASNSNEEVPLSPSMSFESDGNVSQNDSVECSDHPAPKENEITPATEPSAVVRLPSIIKEHYGSKGDVIRITGDCYKDTVVYVHNGRLVVVCKQDREAGGKNSGIMMTRKLPENVDINKACCSRSEDKNTQVLEIFLPSSAPY